MAARKKRLQQSLPLLPSEACDHSVMYGNLCAKCGHVSQVADGMVSLLHSTFAVRVTTHEAERLQQEHTRALLAERRLILVCDLDQTLVHACVDPSVEEWLGDDDTKDVYRIRLPGNPVHYVRLRPHLRTFLQTLSSLYELHIYTLGSRQYADGVAAIIDPEHSLFSDRILSRDEVPDFSFKSLKRLFPMDDSMVLIIDDRAAVWNWCDNLVRVHPYEFFVGAGDINASAAAAAIAAAVAAGTIDPNKDDPEVKTALNLSNASKATSSATQEQAITNPAPQSEPSTIAINEDDDKELFYLQTALEAAHHEFYKIVDTKGLAAADTKIILPAVKKRTLAHTVIVFSGVIPTGTPFAQAEIVKQAQSFGAVCSESLTEETTHLIAYLRTSNFTEKVSSALTMQKVCIVTPQWLNDSIQRWCRQNEALYTPAGIPVDNATIRKIQDKDVEDVMLLDNDDNDAFENHGLIVDEELERELAEARGSEGEEEEEEDVDISSTTSHHGGDDGDVNIDDDVDAAEAQSLVHKRLKRRHSDDNDSNLDFDSFAQELEDNMDSA